MAEGMNIGRIASDIWQGMVDLVYPPKCLSCGEMQPDYLCVACIESIQKMTPPLCSTCGGQLGEKAVCDDCRRIDYQFDSASAYGVYDGALQHAIHQLKYSGHTVIAPILSSFLVDVLRNRHFLLTSIDCIAPLPIHHTRMKERGFNQSKLLSVGPAREFGLPVLKGVLIRNRRTKPQVEVSGSERLENVRGAFEVVKPDAVAGRRVLLIDDVFTTGSTSQAASTALRSAGAREIHVLTVARSV